MRIKVFAAIAALVAGSYPTEAARPDEPMNIVFLLVDDWRGDGYSAAGAPIATPAIDQLASEGARFINSFVPTSVCAPNRASILSGQHVRTHGVADFGNAFTPEQFDHLYPSLLWNAGYRTGFIGKWGVAATGRQLEEAAERFDYWKGVEGQGAYWNDVDGERVHSTKLFAEQANEFIRTTPDDQPFVLSLSFKAAHGPWHEFDPAFEAAIDAADVEVPSTLNESAYAKLPERVRSSRAWREGRGARASSEAHQKSVAGYWRLVAGVDAAIADIRETLAAEGHADDTIIVLTGDNGHLLHEHGLHGKWLMREESVRVPMILFDPRLPDNERGQVRSEFVDSLDIAPTLLSAAGLGVPRDGIGAMAGDSMLPHLRGNGPADDVFYYEYTFQPWPGDLPKLIGVRTPDWKYVRYVEQPVVEALFDLKNDPQETANLAESRGHEAVLIRLRALADERRDTVRNRFPDYDVMPNHAMTHTALANTTGTPYDLADYESVGQSFTATGKMLKRIEFVLPVWRHDRAPAPVDIIIRRDGPVGEIVSRHRIDKDDLYLVNTQRLDMNVATTPGETLFLEAKPMGRRPIPSNRVGWWKTDDNPYDGGTAFLDGEPVDGVDLALSFGFEVTP